MAGIVNIGADVPLNDSGIGISVPKLLTQPPGWFELDGYEEHWREDDMTITRVFSGPWGTRKKFIDYLLGRSFTFVDPQTAALSVSRVLPAQHPEYNWLFATDAKVIGKGIWTNNPNVIARDRFREPILVNGQQVPVPMIAYYDSGTLTDSYSANIAVQYSHRDYELREDGDAWAQPSRELSRYVTRFFKPAVTALPLGKLVGGLTFLEGPNGIVNQTIPEAGVRIIPTVQLMFVLHQFPDIPWTAINNCVGKINSFAFDGAPGYQTYAPGTLLCQAPEIKRIKSIVGRITWEITYRFDYRGSILAFGDVPCTWNHFPASDGQFYLAGWRNANPAPATSWFSYVTNVLPGLNPYNAGAPRPIYLPADFNSLFVPPPPVNYQ